MGGADQYQCSETLVLCWKYFDAALPTVRSIFTIAVRMSFPLVMLGHWYVFLLRGTFKGMSGCKEVMKSLHSAQQGKQQTSSSRSGRWSQMGDSNSSFPGSSAELPAFRPLRENSVTHSNTQVSVKAPQKAGHPRVITDPEWRSAFKEQDRNPCLGLKVLKSIPSIHPSKLRIGNPGLDKNCFIVERVGTVCLIPQTSKSLFKLLMTCKLQYPKDAFREIG